MKFLFILFCLMNSAMAQESDLSASTDIKLSLHKENYLLPYYKHNNEDVPDLNDREEVKFQFSFKVPVIKFESSTIYFAYTQKSFLQAYDDENSRPIRESNYNPEVFFRIGSRALFSDLGYEHESNGQEDPESRSWDRIYLKINFISKFFKFSVKTWHIFDEDAHGPEYLERDKSIDHYYGKWELEWAALIDGTIFKSLVRYNDIHYKGFTESKILWKLGGDFYWGFVYTKGYGDSLRSFNINDETYGVGIFINP